MFEVRLAKFKVKKFKQEIEPQEILLDSLAQKKEKELGVSGKKLEYPLSRQILLGFWLVFLILVFALFGKTFQLQILEGKTFSALAEENRFVIRLIQAERGVIYDKDLNQLVFNKPRFDLISDIGDLPKDEVSRIKVLEEVAGILQKNYQWLEQKINQSQSALIAENLDYETLILLEAKINELPGFKIENNTVREYLAGPFSSHLIGYKRRTGAKTGLEDYYDEILKAKPGELLVKRDVYGNPIAKEIIALPESGKSLVLWLDSELQKKITEILGESIKNVGAKAGAAVALDPKTGGVMALVSFPSFDNNLFSQEISQEVWQKLEKDVQNPFFNRAISGEYPIGSTIKPLIASAVLEENIISPEKQIYAGGLIEVPHKYNPEIIYTFRDWKVHGWTDIKKAIAVSSNVYFYTVGGGYQEQKGLGPSLIKKYLQLFGWGSPTQIDLPGESRGLIPDPAWKKEVVGEDWWDGDTYYLSIGQGFILATPLQIAAAFAAIANGGTLYQPQIVQKILDGQEFKPKIIRENFIDPENLAIVKEGMREGVVYGSSILLNSLPVETASKTGTAQTQEKDVYHNWVTVFAPYDNPQIVLTILIENVSGAQAAALPVAKKALEWYFTR